MKEFGKRGQFYLIAAFVIIALIISFVAVTNYIIKINKETVIDLKKELQIEGEQVINYGIVEGNSINKSALMNHFSAAFAERAEGKQVVFVYGNDQDVIAYQYVEETGGSVGIDLGNTKSKVEIIERAKQEITPTKNGENIEVKIGETNYPFELKKGQNFYFVIIANDGGNVNVATS